MKYLKTWIYLILFPALSIAQMNAEDSILVNQAQLHDFDCYDSNSKKIFANYSNGKETCVIYNLPEKDSIVKYYYTGEIATIGLYYGCQIDTIWSISYSEVSNGKRAISLKSEEDNIEIIDSIEYQFVESFSLHYSPIYEMIFYDEKGKITEKIWKGKPTFIDFKEIERNRYEKP